MKAMMKISKMFLGSAILTLAMAGLASGAQATETFSLNGNKALNTNNNFRRIDGQPRMSIWQHNRNDPDQQFDRLPGRNGAVLLRHRSTGKCLNAHRLFNGAEINVWNCNANDPDQNFNLIGLGNQEFLIQRAGTNLCVDSPTRTDGGRVHLWTCDRNNSNQRFKSTQVTSLGDIHLPFDRGATWYVCQGYNGPISHRGYPALDLTVGNTDFGANNSCWAHDGRTSRSAARRVLAPADGTISWISRDLVCLTMDQNRSLLIGHININSNIRTNQRVTRDTVLGLTSAANRINGGFSHIHIEARRSSGCRPGTSVPFTKQNGFQFVGVGDLPSGQTHWKRALTRP